MQTQSCVANLSGWDARNANIDGFSFHMLAVLRYSRGGASKKLIAPRGAIAAYDVDFGSGVTDRRGEVVQQVKKSWVQRCYITRPVVTQKMIEPVDRIR